jgi:hypothetical protein
MKYLLLLLLTACACVSVPTFKYEIGECLYLYGKGPVKIVDRFTFISEQSYYFLSIWNPLYTYETAPRELVDRDIVEVYYTPIKCR